MQEDLMHEVIEVCDGMYEHATRAHDGLITCATRALTVLQLLIDKNFPGDENWQAAAAWDDYSSEAWEESRKKAMECGNAEVVAAYKAFDICREAAHSARFVLSVAFDYHRGTYDRGTYDPYKTAVHQKEEEEEADA